MKHARTILILSACLVTLDAAALTASIGTVKPETCGNANGELAAYLTGGGTVYQPLSYLWSNGGTTELITGLAAGNYSVTITDAQGTPFIANTTLENVTALPIQFQTPSYVSFFDLLGYSGIACEGQCNGIVSMPMVSFGGTPPFTVDFSVASSYVGLDNNGFPIYSGFCAQDQVDYTVTDALGCQGTGFFGVQQVDATVTPTVTDIQGACAGSDVGGFTVHQNAGLSRVQLYDLNGIPVDAEVQLLEFSNHTYEGLAAGSYTLYTYPMLSQCLVPIPIEVPDLGPGCTQVTGTSWYDADGDCVLDGGEIGIAGSVLLIQPGSQYAITGPNGNFSFNLPVGNYTLAQTDPTLDPYCPATMPAPFTVNGPIANIDLANNSTAPLDLRIHGTASNAQPGFAHTVHASVVNSTIMATGLVTVTCTLDPVVNYVSATPTPLLVSGNVITWEIAELDYFGTQGFTVQTTVPVATPLGTVLLHSFSVASVAADANLSNNTDQATRVVQGSYDPNDKTAVTSSRASDAFYYIDDDEWIDYTIRFQNTGTAPATWVTVTDTLPGTLDMATFQMGVASHAQAVSFKPGRVVEWYFDNINLPDSTSDELGSHGFVKFRIKPQGPLVAGTVIENTANIFFDFNEPVITEPSVLVAESSTNFHEGVDATDRLTVFPDPVSDVLTFKPFKNDPGPFAVELLASDGRLLGSVRTHSRMADVAELAPGLYMIRVNGYSARFIKY